jgi:predicted TIM-barrel fold metal-dependent hydrolase
MRVLSFHQYKNIVMISPGLSSVVNFYFSMSNPRRIDTHFHIVPDFYDQAVEESGSDSAGWKTPRWTIKQAKEHMRILGIETGIMSVTAPGTTIYAKDIKRGRELARRCNEFSAKIVRDEPDRFGFFATVPPMSDVEGTLAEIDYAFNELKADGVTLLTSYVKDGKSLYLGNDHFQPIWEKLEAMEAVVFIHPTSSQMDVVNKYASQPLFDFPQETTRTAGDLVLSGTKGRYPSVKMILSHAGGTVPFLAQRMGSLKPEKRTAEEAQQDFRSFYYDTALSTSRGQLLALLEIADPSRILYGSDAICSN